MTHSLFNIHSQCYMISPPVSAERRQSMGFDFHRECLKCQECGKILNPGQHAEVAGKILIAQF